MRIGSKKSSKKPMIIIGIIVVLAVTGGVGAYLYLNKDSSDSTNSDSSSNQDSTSSSSTQEEDNSTTNETQDTQTETETENQTKVEGKTPVQYEGENFEEETPSSNPDNERFRIPEDE